MITKPSSRCWCGNDRLDDFSPGYFRCARCETLVARVCGKKLEHQDNMTAIVIAVDGDHVITGSTETLETGRV